jgi:hypothetical protein
MFRDGPQGIAKASPELPIGGRNDRNVFNRLRFSIAPARRQERSVHLRPLLSGFLTAR